MKTNKKRYAMLAVTLVLLIAAVSSCAALQAVISKIRGELLGNDYIITQYDNFGERVLQVKGDKIAMSGETDTNGELTSYITITVDGYEWNHVGSTLVFAQRGADMITDFTIPDQMETHKDTSLGLIGADRFVNNYKNLFGKPVVVLISSQNGTPIGLFQGEDCYTEIPADLPKTTLVHIDGKQVYVHRGDIDIFPASMFDAGE